MSTTELQNINLAMLDMAVTEDTAGYQSVMSALSTVKIYNPAPNEKADPAKAGKIRIKLSGTPEAGGGKEVYVDGPLIFTPLSIQFVYNGQIFPRIDGRVADEEAFFTTSEFHKYTKKTDIIGLAAKGQVIGFFEKGQFEQMIRTPSLNGNRNEFYKEKEDMKGRPYDGSRLDKKVIIYGLITEGEYRNEFFRMYINPSVFGRTFDPETKQTIEAEEGTIEHAMAVALPKLNEILVANNRKPVQSIEHRQVDMALNVRTNDKGNFLPVFSYHGLVAMRGVDNTEAVNYIKELREEHHRSIFGDGTPAVTPIMIIDGQATATIQQVKVSEEKQAMKQLEEASEVFADKHLDAPDF